MAPVPAWLWGAPPFFSFDFRRWKDQLAHFIQCLPDRKRDALLRQLMWILRWLGCQSTPNPTDGVEQELGEPWLEGPGSTVWDSPPNLILRRILERVTSRGRFDRYPPRIRNVKTKSCTEGGTMAAVAVYQTAKASWGYEGEETFIDMNVYCGSREQWENWYGNRNKS